MDASPPVSGFVAGVVIAGGRSLRFGGEKAAALLDGVSLLIRAARRLQASCPVVAINARPATEAELLARRHGLPVIHDAPGDADGPLAGVKAGLIWAKALGARAIAVSPCDAPLLPDDVFARLIEEAGTGCAMAETSEGNQPLTALWPVSALPALTEALRGGAHPATWRILDSLGAKHVRFHPPEAFANLNTREDLAKLAAHFTRDARVIGLAGWSGSGKTTLLTRLIPLLVACGLRVATIKHAHHSFEVDHPGKDSYEHRKAGATEVIVSSARRWVQIHEGGDAPEAMLPELLSRLSPCDLIIVEGYKREAHPKLEVFRQAIGRSPLHPLDPRIVAVASDRAFPDAGIPVVNLNDIARIADIVIAHAEPLSSVLARLKNTGDDGTASR
jgi:molybdopterin-guanine dinucleotide biosynthesis protein B